MARRCIVVWKGRCGAGRGIDGALDERMIALSVEEYVSTCWLWWRE